MTERRISKKHIAFIFLTFFAYFVYASYFNGFGANATVMMDFYQITAARQGLVFTTQAFGALVVLVYFALYGERYNKINVYLIGMTLYSIAAFLIGLTPSSFGVLITLAVIAGVGYSAGDVMLNGMVPELFPKYKTTLIPLLHAFFGAGAMVTPLLITAIVNPDIPITFGRPFMIFGGLSFICVLILIPVSRKLISETPYVNLSLANKQKVDKPFEMVRSANAWLVLAASFLYFSFQVGLMSWLPTFSRYLGMDFDSSGAMITAFFAGSLIMRFCSPLILKFFKPKHIYIVLTLIACVLVAAALILGGSAMAVLLAVGGFMQGACVSLLVLMSIDAFPTKSAFASSLVFIASTLASMTSPLWIGAVAEVIGFQIPLLIACGLLPVSTLLVYFLTRVSHTK